MKKPIAEFSDFEKLDIRIGTILLAEPLANARKPAYKLLVDFGAEIGQLYSSAQITELYLPDNLIGKQVLGVVNFAPKKIAGFTSQCLVLGIYNSAGVVLISPERPVKNGEILG